MGSNDLIRKRFAELEKSMHGIHADVVPFDVTGVEQLEDKCLKLHSGSAWRILGALPGI